MTSLEHLLARLGGLEERVRSLIAARRATDADPDDRFRGLYLSHGQVERFLHGTPPGLDGASVEASIAEIDAAAGALEDEPETRLRSLAVQFELTLIDTELLLVALAPDIDRRFEHFYGYLQDDVTRRRASVGLALTLCGRPHTDAGARASLSPRGQLVRHGLLMLEEVDRSVLGRSLRVRDRIVNYLLGDDASDEILAQVLDLSVTPSPLALSEPLQRALAEGVTVTYIRDSRMSAGLTTAVSSAAAMGADSVAVDLTRLAQLPDQRAAARAAVLEARLTRRVLVAGPVDALIDQSRDLIRLIADSHWPTVLVGETSWEPTWSDAVPLLLDAPQPAPEDRVIVWRTALNGHGPAVPGEDHAMLDAGRAFRLKLPQVSRAIQAGRLQALAENRSLEPADIQAGARAQSARGLDNLAHRISPAATWSDLVVPREVGVQLRELSARARLRERVLDEWQIGGRASRGRGITALFAGESGTGKTLAAEIIAAELGLDLYVIDLSTVVDKYIGETEKNLDRIFEQADRVNGVLLFDEADAIFGKRSEVRDARDRYANLEVAYLLQRMERFDGLAVLTTNLRSNLDDAFTRRIDVIVDFPMPDEDARLALWRMHLPSRLPQAPDLDLQFLANRFRISGGNVRNVCLTAAFFAAEADSPVSMSELIRGMEREYRKLGRLTPEAEFGPYHALIQ
jgi:hypothetical protein